MRTAENIRSLSDAELDHVSGGSVTNGDGVDLVDRITALCGLVGIAILLTRETGTLKGLG